MRRSAVLVAWVLVLGVAAVGALPTAPAVAQQATASSDLCDTGTVEQFTDVADGDYAAAYVLCMRALGLSRGAGAGTYSSDRELNRAQMASFLVRLWRDVLGNQCPTGVVTPFTDVAAGSTHAENIDCLYGLEITTGTGADTYGPRDPLKATQISRFLYRTYRKAGGDMCPRTGGSELDRAVGCLSRLRVVPGEAEATATTPVTRAQMGVYVVGLWHNLAGRGLPPVPPYLNEPTTRRPAANLPALRIAYTAGTNYEAGPWSPDSTKILYYSGDFAGWGRGFPSGELWVVDANGANRRQLSIGGRNPVWSPDSTRVLYEDEDDEYRLWVVNADGSGKQQLSASSFYEEWSPDGARILYNDRDGLWVVNADGSGKQQLTTRGREVEWSPDSTRVLYSDLDRGGLWVVSADGTGERQLTTSRRFETGHGPSSWSPDSTKILYSHIVRGQDSGVDEMWVVNADGTNPQQLVAPGDGLFDYYSVVWSPDSSRVLYVHSNGGIWAGDTDGTKQRLTTHGRRPRFSPDGTKVLYVDSAESWALGALWVMDADGTNQRRLASGAKDPIVWSPDGTRITYFDGNDRVWVVNADGTNRLQLVFVQCGGLAWAADSVRILYYTARSEDRSVPLEFWVVDTDGTNRRQVVDFGGSPSLSPDSANIAYSGPQGAIWVVDADGTNRRRLTTTRSVWAVNSDGADRQQVAGNGWLPQWSPDGTRLAVADSDGYRVVNPDGAISQSLGSPGSVGLHWSPDSTKISYINSFNGDLVFADADGNRLRPSYSGRGTSLQWSPDSARVIFQRSGAYWVMNADGTNIRQLATGTVHTPSWSPDGTGIAYTDASDAYDRDRGVVVLNRHRIRVANADGRELYSVSGHGARWSPDGARIGYTVWSACEYDTAYDCPSYWVMNADGTNRRQLTDQDSSFEGWSPDSTRIAYRADGWLWVVNADGTNRRQLTDQAYRRAEWSPSSTGLIYWVSGTSGEAPSDELWVVSADGTNRRQLTDQLFVTTSFWHWSPDGARIGYLADGLWVADADGTNRRQLSNQEISSAIWSPDSTRIAYVADGLWVVNADGTNRIQLAKEGGHPRWSPSLASGGG